MKTWRTSSARATSTGRRRFTGSARCMLVRARRDLLRSSSYSIRHASHPNGYIPLSAAPHPAAAGEGQGTSVLRREPGGPMSRFSAEAPTLAEEADARAREIASTSPQGRRHSDPAPSTSSKVSGNSSRVRTPSLPIPHLPRSIFSSSPLARGTSAAGSSPSTRGPEHLPERCEEPLAPVRRPSSRGPPTLLQRDWNPL
jgi:hypothetical protein